jgi:hypothetical protein
MKRLPVFILFLLTSFLTYSQYGYHKSDPSADHHKGGEIILSFSPTVLLKTPNGSQIAGGIKIQVFISKRFSFDADLVFSRNYLHLSPGLVGVPLGIIGLTFGSNDELTLGNFLLSIAAIGLAGEHVSYHIPMSNTFDISPYVSLLRYKYAYKSGNYSDPGFIDEQLCFASGAQINKYFGRFVLAPYAEYSIGYKDKIPGCNFGVYFGILFPAN